MVVINTGLRIFLALTIPKTMDLVTSKHGTEPTHFCSEGINLINTD